MSNFDNVGTWVVGMIGSIYAFATGNFETATLVLMGIMTLDVASGVLKGLKNKNLKSAIMSVGLMKKGGILLAIAFAGLLDLLLNSGTPIFTPMMTWLSIGNEGLSVVENISALGVEFPKAMKDRLGQISEDYENIQHEKEVSYKNKDENNNDLSNK